MEMVISPGESILLSSHSAREPLRILIIDDDRTDRILVRGCLQRSGLSIAVDEAGSGAEALQLIEFNPYDCVILDYYLPDMDGFAVFKSLHTTTPDTPVIILTGVGDEDLAVELMKAGAGDYLPKASMTPERLQAGVRYVMELQRAEAKRREDERRVRELLGALPVAVYTTDASGRITYYNQAAADLWGDRPELSKSEFCGSWRLYWPDGGPMRHDECPMAVALKERRPIRGAEAAAERPDGARVPFLAFPTPLVDESGALVGAVNTLVDITERKQAEEQLNLVLREMRHRVRNLFAIASSLVAQSARSARTPEELVKSIRERLGALARAHDMVRPGLAGVAEQMGRTTLDALLRAIFSPYLDHPRASREQAAFDGPALPIGGNAITALALVLHELATNAAKYGALSSPTGSLKIDWSVKNDELMLTWQERGGPSLDGPPSCEGFGSLLARRTVTDQLGGQLSHDWQPQGLVVRLSAPVERLTT
jgi:PAS domain S-box-containing protein